MKRCGACRKPIEQKAVVELTARLVRQDDGESADSIKECYDDYCDECIGSGKAVADLLTELNQARTKYEADDAD